MHDAGIARRIAARYREKGAGAQPLECRLAVEFEADLQVPREFVQKPTIAARVERIGRQRRQPSGQIVAGGRRQREIELG